MANTVRATVSTWPASYVVSWPVGTMLCSVGIVLDGAAGIMLLEGASWRGIVLHAAAWAVWVLGVGVLEQCVIAHWARPGGVHLPLTNAARVQVPLHLRWTVTAAVLGGMCFPGVGPAGCTLALLIMRPIPQGADPSKTAADHIVARIYPKLHGEPVDILGELDVQPLIDIVNGADAELKRAAISVLSQDAGPRAVRLLRCLLIDGDPDVRSDAAVALTRIEREISNTLNRSLGELDGAGPSADRLANAARDHRRYAHSDLLDDVSAGWHLTRAREALQQAAALAPARVDLWVSLAEVAHEQADADATLAALDQAFAIDPNVPAGCLLGMEIAFQSRDWGRLAVLAQQGGVSDGQDGETQNAVTWWRDVVVSSGA